jgi:hypothetical protein
VSSRKCPSASRNMWRTLLSSIVTDIIGQAGPVHPALK